MAVYSSDRRRTIVILLLTTVLLITLDLRGNAVFNGARSGFNYAMAPFETAGEVITRPAERIWSGITEVDDLKAENERLQTLVDQSRSAEVAGQNALIENRELRELLGLELLSSFDRKTGEVIGSSPSNFDQRVEIDRGSTDGIRVGMPVVNEAGLVGKITNVFPTTSVVMLVTDPQYHVPVKVVAEVFPEPEADDEVDSFEPPVTVPSGLPVGDVTTTASPTTTTTTLAPAPVTSTPLDGTAPAASTVTSTTSTTTTTTTTLPEPIEELRETGDLNGFGGDRLPRVRFVLDSPQFGRVQVGDQVLTAGGSLSLAPPGIPVGTVANVITNAGTAGLELEVELNVDLNRLNFLSVILYQPPTELG